MELINPAVDLHAAKEEFNATGMVIIKNYLVPTIAEELYDCLDALTTWGFTYYADKDRGQVNISHRKLKGLSAKRYAKILPTPPENFKERFSYAHDVFWILEEMAKGKGPKTLQDYHKALNTVAYIQTIKAVVGLTQMIRLDASASCYRPGHFLTAHSDGPHTEKFITHVLGLTKGWQEGWGGQLTFCDASGEVLRQLTPSFNTLVLFKNPREHYVTTVSKKAGKPRYSVYSWLRWP